jgi:hypothetical protein
MMKGKFKRIVSKDEYFSKADNNEQVFSVHALIVFTIFCFLVDEKLELKGLACFFEITYSNFENPCIKGKRLRNISSA